MTVHVRRVRVHSEILLCEALQTTYLTAETNLGDIASHGDDGDGGGASDHLNLLVFSKSGACIQVAATTGKRFMHFT